MYYKGRPCRHCGGTRRYTKTRNCVACSAKRSREYAREHADLVNAERRRRRAANLEKCRAQDRRYYQIKQARIANVFTTAEGLLQAERGRLRIEPSLPTSRRGGNDGEYER